MHRNATFGRPYGTHTTPIAHRPSSKLLGYYQTSLRDGRSRQLVCNNEGEALGVRVEYESVSPERAELFRRIKPPRRKSDVIAPFQGYHFHVCPRTQGFALGFPILPLCGSVTKNNFWGQVVFQHCKVQLAP